jgi:hypothetical protein
VSWGLGEKLVFFWPFAGLSFFAPWLFAREILRSPHWALLSALIYASSTYLLLVSTGGQLLVAMAAVLAPLVLWAFVRALRRLSVADAVLAGLLVAVQAAYEVRITYLTLLLCALYLLALLVGQRNLRIAIHQAWLAALPVLILLGSQLYWLVPLATYRGDNGLPIASTPFQAFMTISHGFTGVHPFWTGAAPTIFHVAPLNPVFFVFPLLAFTLLLLRRGQPEVLWLCLAALTSAFLIKQDNPPFGAIYDWLFYQFPGWSLFREASKLFFIVAISYAVLIPISLRQLWRMRIAQVGRLEVRPPASASAQPDPSAPVPVHPLLVRGTPYDVFVTPDGRFLAQHSGREFASTTREGLHRMLRRFTKPRTERNSAVVKIWLSLLRVLASTVDATRALANRELRRLPQLAAVAGVLIITALSANNFIPVLAGEAGYTTQPWQEPSSFIALEKILDGDRRFGSVLWLGGASVGSTSNPVRHLFPVASPGHPLVEVSGLSYNDVLSRYCPDATLPFCYLGANLFPYLVERLGVAYVVAPAGDEVGTLPAGVSAQWLSERVGAILGRPQQVLGTGGAALSIWQMGADGRPVTVSTAVAVVDGTVQRAKDAAPALLALHLPAIYRSDELASQRADAPGASIEVVPGVEGTYEVKSPGPFAVMALGNRATLELSIEARSAVLPLLIRTSLGDGWNIYGPASLKAGVEHLTANDGTILGPLFAWSADAMGAIRGDNVVGLSATGSNAEGLTVEGAPAGAHWVEFRGAYDSGWSMNSASTHLEGDGMFNLYWASNLSGTTTFRFITAPWELLGVGLALAAALAALVAWLLIRNAARPSTTELDPAGGDGTAGGLAFQAALVGILLTVVAAASQAIGWWSGGGGDTYGRSEFLVAVAMLALAVAVITQLADRFVEARTES